MWVREGPEMQYPHGACLADTLGHVKQLLQSGQPGGLLPALIAEDLPADEFHIIDDEELRALDRQLDVVVERRVGRVGDRLEGIAGAVAKTISEPT
jgi:hypothetical protein